MKIVIFGLTMSSSWGNGHATLWRGLCKSLQRLGHDIVFFERNRSFYAAARDASACERTELVIYDDWHESHALIAKHLRGADVAIVTSYCTDALAACEEIRELSRALAVFYDLDTPITLSRVAANEAVPYIGPSGLAEYDLVLSYTGGGALEQLQAVLGARRVAPLYGHVDPQTHRPVAKDARYRADLSYLGTFAQDRQQSLEALFIGPARSRPDLRFMMGGAQYPDAFPWTTNVYFVHHVPPEQHAPFYCSSRLTLNVTRGAMAQMGWCPSGRLFEAAACRAAILSDCWQGLAAFYEPNAEILVASSTQDALAALDRSDAELAQIAERAYERTLEQHTSAHRALEMIALLEAAMNDRSRGIVTQYARPSERARM